MTTLLAFALLFCFFMAWMIGANDVANAMGTSVGSKALTLKQAVLAAAIFEFAGAFLVGGGVTQTVRKGIVDPTHFANAELFPQPAEVRTGSGADVEPEVEEPSGLPPADREPAAGEPAAATTQLTGPKVFAYGMLSALIAAVLWLFLANRFGIPVSTTHSIVGAIVGFALAVLIPKVGIAGAIQWAKMGKIAVGWIASPVAGGVIAFLMFSFVRRFVLRSATPLESARRVSPYLVGLVVVVVILSAFLKGLKNLHLEEAVPVPVVAAIAVVVAIIFGMGTRWVIRRRARSGKAQEEFFHVEAAFRRLQVVTACYVAFAHGSNDVANAVGPLAAILEVERTGLVAVAAAVPPGVLMIGGLGIVFGLATWGYRVIETVGKKITAMTPSRGFSAEFATATVVLIFSLLHLPISTTQTLVGSVLGVGLARGVAALDLKVIRGIFSAWILELPLTATLAAIIFGIIRVFLL